ncbi:MAG: DoxX family protein [Streptosporangiales bacterium]|nr:DoxX family protein [Streptosporangiales bacterium]
MNIVLWILAGLLALAFLGSGLMKIIQSKEKLAASGQGWTEDFSAGAIKGIAVAEILAAFGLILPAVTGIATVLTPLAALGLVVVMAGAAIVHGRRKETQGVVVTLLLLVLAAVVAWGRFGPYAF